MRKYLALFVVAILLGSCATKTTVPTIITNPVIDPGMPRQLSLKEVEYKVYNKEELRKALEKADAEGTDIVLIAVSAKGYENSATNMAEIKRYILQLIEVIKYYKSANEDLNTKLEKKKKADRLRQLGW